MKILITNDDGVFTPWLPSLVRWARKWGEVTVVAPKVEQSGKSHGIEIIKPFEIKKVSIAPDIEAYSVDSSPADCVRYGVIGMKRSYDLVISGVNRGYNIGHDMVYSGTVGAVYEAAWYGLNSLAISTDPKAPNGAAEYLDTVFDYLMKQDLFSANRLYNVNIPLHPKGIRITRQGVAHYSDDFEHVEGDLYRQVGDFIPEDSDDPALDTVAIQEGYISVLPLTNERTDLSVFEKLRASQK